jgi:drug/metabolite transporter (DMT)-like permease
VAYIGEITGLGAAFCWMWTMLLFSLAGERIGSLAVNVIRLSIALPLLIITTTILFGVNYSELYAGGNVWYLYLSGFIGLALGDAALFYALVAIGPRKTSLIFSSVPIATSLIAFFTIGERMSLITWVSIFITVSGIVWVISEKSVENKRFPNKALTKGVIAVIIGVIFQAAGLVLSKAGMGGTVDPLPATLVRIFAGTIGMYLYVIVTRNIGTVLKGFRDMKAIALTAGGAFFGPFLGIWLSIISVKYTETGVTATLSATVPIMILPFAYFVYKEKLSGRTIIGTLMAVAGIVLLFNR